VSLHKLGAPLRDRYYLGVIEYDGVEYQGRHQPLVSEELFNRVQRVLDAHSGSGVRYRTHHHYLKGLVWCGRCKSRFTVQRAQGRRGGIYYYFLCRGRLQGNCDQRYLPVEVVEDAVASHYGHAVSLPDEFQAEVRAAVDEAVDESTNCPTLYGSSSSTG
jgi:hypothetical protein